MLLNGSQINFSRDKYVFIKMFLILTQITALKTLANITAVIRDLFHMPPSYKSQIGLSWRPLARLAGAKRKSNPPSEQPVEKAKSSRDGPIQIYQPPSGKFSGRAGNFGMP